MITKPLYLEDTYLFESTAKVVAVENDEQGTLVVLDETIFYPQGGGQPTDIGTITFSNVTFRVTKVLYRTDGSIAHYGNFSNGEFHSGESVALVIDQSIRIKNARNHTAGHVLTFAVEVAYPHLVGMKGYHFPDGTYVEFDGILSEEDKALFSEKISDEVRGMIEKELPITIKLVTSDELALLCKNVLPNMPKDKPMRVMIVDGIALGCGGTHLSNTKEIGTFSIRKIKQEKGKLKVSYLTE